MGCGLYREISHTADVAYEFEFEDLTELLRDIIEVVKENVELEGTDHFRRRSLISDTGRSGSTYGASSAVQKSRPRSGIEGRVDRKRKCFKSSEKEPNEDFLFDFVNDIISLVDRGWYPEKVSGKCVYFVARPLVCKIKALTYHGLRVSKVGEKFIARMVFDR